MRYLLDTNIVIYAIYHPAVLRPEIRELLRKEADLWYSAAVPWEIAIKSNLGKLSYAMNDLLSSLRDEQFRELPITAAHGIEGGMLPLHHRDPFDRVMLAQARLERMRFVTTDRPLARYDADVLLA